jgi:hypothetical protein
MQGAAPGVRDDSGAGGSGTRPQRRREAACAAAQSKPGPGSRLRPGATCSWPTTSRSDARDDARNSRAARVLRGREGAALQALDLDADRPVVAVVATRASVDTPACPRARGRRTRTAAVRRRAGPGSAPTPRSVRRPGEVGWRSQSSVLVNRRSTAVAAVHARRQADRVQHHQAGPFAGGPRPEVGRWAGRAGPPALVPAVGRPPTAHGAVIAASSRRHPVDLVAGADAQPRHAVAHLPQRQPRLAPAAVRL